jgi:hypothetical protein
LPRFAVAIAIVQDFTIIDIEEDEMGGAYSTNGGEEERICVLVGKSEGKRPLGRPRRMCG